VAVLINKAMIEIPPKFAGRPPINPEARKDRSLIAREWRGAQGLSEDVRYYGQWMRNEAEKRIGHLYPKVAVTPEMVQERPDLKPLVGKELKVIAWLWARTVKSPNPAFAQADVPLVSTFMLATRKGKQAYVEPVVTQGKFRFTIRTGEPKIPENVLSGTKLSRGSFRCLYSGVPIPYEYADEEANAGRMGARMMAVVAESNLGRIYLPPQPEMEEVARRAQPDWKPEAPSRGTWASNAQGRRYGFETFGDYFSARQLVALTTLADLVQEVHGQARRDAISEGMKDEGKGLEDGGCGAVAYADAIAVYCGLAVDKSADYNSTLVVWSPTRDQAKSTFARQAIPMVWDYAEVNPLAGAAGDITVSLQGISRALENLAGAASGFASQADAATQMLSKEKIVSTDPPYYDNIGYADLSDFFYVWMRRSLKPLLPSLFTTLAVPKAEELVATLYRHGSREKAEAFFLEGMTRAMHRLAEQAHPAFPVTIYYAFKQAESESSEGTASTGWETFLDAVIRAGFTMSGTWPMRTERGARSIGIGTNALASSIILVCRPRAADSPAATRREFVAALRAELPLALRHLQRGNIAPVDLAQAAIGPGMAVYTRYGRVLDASGKPLSVRDSLALINQTLDEVLAEQEGDFDADTRWALTWFEQFCFDPDEFGRAETLATARNTSVRGMEEAGILVSKGGKVRLLKPSELPADWDPATDPRLTHWEVVHHLIRVLEAEGEGAAAALVTKLGSAAEVARELAYRLYTVGERKKRAQEALSYNGLVQSWPEITRLAQEANATATAAQGALF
jgi:putative DNA methylase